MNVQGKMQPINGSSIFTGACIASCSARVWRSLRHCAACARKTGPRLAPSASACARAAAQLRANGLLLRSDLHILFDRGYVTVNPELRIEVSPRIREEYENGREYYALHGRPLVAVPTRETQRPSHEFLDWHNRNVFVS